MSSIRIRRGLRMPTSAFTLAVSLLIADNALAQTPPSPTEAPAVPTASAAPQPSEPQQPAPVSPARASTAAPLLTPDVARPPPIVTTPTAPAVESPPEPAVAPPPASAPTPAKRESQSSSSFSTVVLADKPMTAASTMTVREQDLRLRPIQRVGDLLRVAPGLITVQHAGGGKANQYLLRGFDADHGTDIALTVDGVPINMVSHGHGQGYADTNWIIPEMIDRIEVYKGPYFAELGDFATAGAINLVTKRALKESFVTIQGGMFNTLRALAAAGPSFGKVRTLFLGEGSYSDGPFLNPERFKKYNLFAKLTYDLSTSSSISLAVSSYGGDWYASGQIPSREVDAGRLNFFGNIDPTEGGNSSRYNVYLSYQFRDGPNELTALAYFSRYTLKIYSNFTLFSADSENGDGILQGDERYLGGLRANYRRRQKWRWLRFDTSIGISARFDDIHNSLDNQRAREQLATVAAHQVRETSLALYVKEEIAFSRWVRLIAALRTDGFFFDVTDLREDLATQNGATSGVRGDVMFSPKATLVVSPHRTVDLFVNFGRGFHSNDGRGVVRAVDPVTPLTPALGYEVGARTRLFNRLDLAASFWGLDLDSELVWLGDEGTTEASAPSRRLGFEFEGRMRILDWLFADLDLTVNDAKFTQNAGNGNSVALAPRLTVAAGISAVTPFGLRGSLRFTGIGPRPATADEFLTAEGSYLLDAFVSYRWRFIEVGLSVENLTNSRYKAAQFATTSRLRSEPPTNMAPPPNACPAGTRAQTGGDGNFIGCEDVSFSPGYPLNVQARATVYF